MKQSIGLERVCEVQLLLMQLGKDSKTDYTMLVVMGSILLDSFMTLANYDANQTCNFH